MDTHRTTPLWRRSTLWRRLLEGTLWRRLLEDAAGAASVSSRDFPNASAASGESATDAARVDHGPQVAHGTRGPGPEWVNLLRAESARRTSLAAEQAEDARFLATASAREETPSLWKIDLVCVWIVLWETYSSRAMSRSDRVPASSRSTPSSRSVSPGPTRWVGDGPLERGEPLSQDAWVRAVGHECRGLGGRDGGGRALTQRAKQYCLEDQGVREVERLAEVTQHLDPPLQLGASIVEFSASLRSSPSAK